jgi:hypothetical protein
MSQLFSKLKLNVELEAGNELFCCFSKFSMELFGWDLESKITGKLPNEWLTWRLILAYLFPPKLFGSFIPELELYKLGVEFKRLLTTACTAEWFDAPARLDPLL